eukprot:COSAG02_NODE_280_length_25797_cov_66.644447_3_plen_75_part_00
MVEDRAVLTLWYPRAQQAALRLVHPDNFTTHTPLDDEDEAQEKARVMRELVAQKVFACLQDAFGVFRDQAPGLR